MPRDAEGLNRIVGAHDELVGAGGVAKLTDDGIASLERGEMAAASGER